MEVTRKKVLRSTQKVNATTGNDYENIRRLRMEENNQRLEALGLHKIGQKNKTKKRKQKHVENADNDADYRPDSLLDEIDEQLNEEPVTKVKSSKKKQNVRFIAPMTITRQANLSKKRVVATTNVSRALSENSQMRKGQGGDKTRPKKSSVQHSEKGSKSNGQQFHTSYSKGRNVLPTYDENEEYEDIEVTNRYDDDVSLEDVRDDELDATENIHYENENSLEYDTHVGYDYEDTEVNQTATETEVNDTNEVVQDELDTNEVVQDEPDTNEVVQDEPDTNEVVQDELEAPQRENEADGMANKNVRGPTRMRNVWGQRHKSERITIVVNDHGQPINESSSQLTHFMGTISRSGTYFPLHLPWNKVPADDKDALLHFLRTRFIIPKAADPWILKSFGKKVKNWRARLKVAYFDESLSTRQQIRSRPPEVEKKQWKRLISYWKNDEIKSRSEKNKENRAKKKMMQFTGKKSYARIREELKAENEGRSPTRTEMFQKCFSKAGTSQNEDVSTAIEEMQKLTSTLPDGSFDKPAPDDVFSKVRGNNKYGAADMYGLGVRASDLWGKIPSRAAVHIENCQLKSKNDDLEEENVTLKAQLAEKNGSSTTQCPIVAKVHQQLKVGNEVFMHSILNSNEKVARGWLISLDPTEEIGGIEIGQDWCVVNVQAVMKKGESLIRPYDLFVKIDDALGAPVAWPCSFITIVPLD